MFNVPSIGKPEISLKEKLVKYIYQLEELNGEHCGGLCVNNEVLIFAYPFAGNRVRAHRRASFQNTHHTTTIQPNAPRINRNTLHMVKFMKTILFGCET